MQGDGGGVPQPQQPAGALPPGFIQHNFFTQKEIGESQTREKVSEIEKKLHSIKLSCY